MFETRIALALLIFGVSACGQAAQPVSITFHGKVGQQTFACGQSYAGLGTTATAAKLSDFRLYVHDVRLIDSAGAEQPVALDQDALWQYENVALLDFEDKTSPCDGTAATNSTIHGSAASGSGSYAGLRFVLGVPAALNHENQATAPAPLNYTSLFWTWQDGYKFMRTEGKTVGAGSAVMFHLGSTGCVKDGSGQTQCQTPNTAAIELAGFNPQKNSVAVDLAALFAGSDLSQDMMCMSEPGSAACSAIFARLGLPFAGAAASPQKLFRVE